MSHKEMYCLGVISYANFQTVVISLQHGFQNKSNKYQRSNKAELLLAELGRDFLEVEGKGYRSVTGKNWEKKRKA